MKQNKFDRKKTLFKKQADKVREHKNKRESKPGLTLGMIRIIILCLLVPYVFLSVVLFYYSTVKTNSRIRDTVTSSMENAAEICSMNIESSIEASKKASYE